MARKVRIQRTKKPWLHNATQRNFDVAKGLLMLLELCLGPWIDQQKAYETQIKIYNRQADTELKVIRQSLTAENARRQELLNIETRLKLEAKYDKKRVAELLGEPIKPEDQFTPQNY